MSNSGLQQHSDDAYDHYNQRKSVPNKRLLDTFLAWQNRMSLI